MSMRIAVKVLKYFDAFERCRVTVLALRSLNKLHKN